MNIAEFAKKFERLVTTEHTYSALIAEGRQLLQELLKQRDLIAEAVDKVIRNDDFLSGQILTIDPNEITLHRSSQGNFSLRLFIWEPGVIYPVHDHGSWGVVGAWAGTVEESKYRRLDDGNREGYADLALKNKAALATGELTAVLPLNDGIHQMGAVGDLPALTVHAYGKPIRKGYIQYFNPQEKKVTKVFAPKLSRKIVALRALASVNEDWAKLLLNEMCQDKHPQLSQEAQCSLKKMQKS